MIVFQ